MSEFEEKQKRDVLYYNVCVRYLKKIGPFGGDTIANDAVAAKIRHVIVSEGGAGMDCWEDLLRMTADLMVGDIRNGTIDTYDMPEHYERACVQINTGDITTQQELAQYLDAAEPDDHDALCGMDVTIRLDESLCKTLTTLLIKPEAPIKVTAITGTVSGVESWSTDNHDLALDLTGCRILTESK